VKTENESDREDWQQIEGDLTLSTIFYREKSEHEK